MSGFVGRHAELRDLEAAVESVVSGRGEFVMISGEAGIGKTRLCEELGERAAARGVRVTWTRCWETGVPAFWPWEHLLRQIADEPMARPDGHTGEDDAELARLRYFDDVVAAVAYAASRQPLLIILDDLQWADVASVRLLTYLTLSRGMAVLTVAIYRDGESAPGTPLGDAILALARTGRRLHLAGLGADDIPALIGSVAAAPAEIDAAELHRVTGGNPLFAQELVRLRDVQGALGRFGPGAPSPVPATVRAVLERRLGNLSPECRTLLETGAVIGDEFSLGVVEAVVGGVGIALLELLGEALAARLLREAGVARYAFSHALVRATLYEDLGVAHRVRLHQRVGAALERMRNGGHEVDLAALAHHFVQAAAAGGAAKAATYAVQAGEAAMSRFAYENATRLFQQALSALDLDPSAGNRCAVLLGLGGAQVAAGSLASARDTYLRAAELARNARRAEQLAEAALGVGGGGGFEVALADRGQIDLLEEARAALAGTPSALRARVTARLSVALSLSGSITRRLALAEEAVAMARRVGDRPALAYALAAHCDATSGPADTATRTEESAEIIELARAIGDRGTELLGRRLRIVALFEAGDIAGVEAEIEAFARLADVIRQPLYGWYAPLWRGTRALIRGELALCDQLVAQAGTVGAQAESENAVLLTEALRWYVHREAGDMEYTAAFEQKLAYYEPTLGTQIRVTETLVLADLGRIDEARARLDADAAAIRALPVDSEWVSAVIQLSQAIAQVGGHALAGWAYDALLPHRRLFGVEGIGAAWSGSVERPLGLLAAAQGRAAEAAAHFDAAVEANRAAGSPLFVARTLRDAGVALEDRERLAAALAAYRELGVHRRVAELERRLGRFEAPAPNAFRREGDVWALGFAGRLVRVKEVKGLQDLAVLLARPGREVAARDLAGAPGAPPQRGLDDGLDERATNAYRARLVELRAELEDADRAGDPVRSRRAQEEHDAIVAQLTAAYGLGGRPRRIGGFDERARQAVSWRIREALARIERVHPELAAHLRASVRTGAFCVYDPREPVSWSL